MRALLLIILLSGADNFVIEKRVRNAEQKLLLRRLLSLQQNNSTGKYLMWNEILANALVNKIKTIFAKQPEDGIEDEPDVITKCVGSVIGLFKKLYWDKTKTNPTYPAVENDKNNVSSESGDPKSEVEILEPKYYGRIENGTEEPNVEGRSVCPGDSVSDGKGACVDPKTLKYIMAIPYQCPWGYMRDGLGYCRALF